MRFGPDDTFWVVVDPTPASEMGDVVFESSLRELELQFKGGLTIDRNPTIFTDRREAEIEAYGRLVAARASRAIARSEKGADLEAVSRIELIDADGTVVLEADL